MAKKPRAIKVKANPNKPAKRPIVNIQYFHVYNEVLKFEEVMDIDLDIIASAVIDVMTEAALDNKLGDEPTEGQIETLVAQIVDKLVKENPPNDGLFNLSGKSTVWDCALPA